MCYCLNLNLGHLRCEYWTFLSSGIDHSVKIIREFPLVGQDSVCDICSEAE